MTTFTVNLFFISMLFVLDVSASVGFGNCSSVFPQGSILPSACGTFPPQSVALCRDGVIGMCYDAANVAPAWSAYYVTPSECKNNVPGRDSFYQDPDLKALGVTQASVDSPAFSTEWNRGHVAPSHVMSWTQDTKYACYTMANIAPQAAYFNQGPWAALETNVFNWILANSPLYIVTGVAYDDRNAPTKSYNISVPDYYFKVICDPQAKTSAGFYGRNDCVTTCSNNTCGVFRTVAAVEQLYGGTLLPADLCNTGSVDESHWW